MLTPEQQRLLQNVIASDVGYIETFMRVPAKQGKTSVPFILRPAQRRMVSTLTGRDLWVKDGQIGATTAALGVMLKRTLTVPYTTTVVVAYEAFITQRLLERAQVMYDSIPDAMKPPIHHASSYEKSFPSINSVMYIGTARAAVLGRGEPIHHLLLSEAAFYEPHVFEAIVVPALQRVPPPPDGMVIAESTPNGEGGWFYEEVMAARRGKSTFSLQTFCWWDNPDNVLPADTAAVLLPEERAMSTLTAEELALRERVKAETGTELTLDQLRWRRWKIREIGELFWQEHMESLDTAFLTRGMPYFDATTLEELARGCYPGQPGPYGCEVWEEPQEGGSYVMGVDPGQGRTTETAMTIWRFDERIKQVGRLSGLFDDAATLPRVIEIGRYFNTALVVPEANAHGIALVSGLVRERYPRIYVRRDMVNGTLQMAYGWLTGPSTKPFMLAEMQRRLPTLETHDALLVQQMRAVRDLGDGRVGSRMLDDVMMSACLAMVGLIGQDPKRQRGYVGASGWRW